MPADLKANNRCGDSDRNPLPPLLLVGDSRLKLLFSVVSIIYNKTPTVGWYAK